MNKKRTQKYRQSVFQPRFPEKYKGTFPILLRSSWELSVARILDSNPNIISWGSESVVIPYENPLTGRISRYFVDFNITMRDKEGNLKKFLVEIKPAVQTIPPKPTRNIKSSLRRQAEYVKNRAKWDAAQQFATKKGSMFIILTEKHLGLAK
jgi:hypothetical protein